MNARKPAYYRARFGNHIAAGMPLLRPAYYRARLCPITLAMFLTFWAIAPIPVRAESFTLQAAMDYALQHNKALAAQREDVPAAEGVAENAMSNMLPHVGIEGDYFHVSKVPEILIDTPPIPTKGVMTITKKMGSEDNYKAEIKLQQLLFASGQAYEGWRMARQGSDAARHSVLAGEDDLARQVAEAWWSVLLAQEVAAARADALRISEEHLADVRRRFDNGAASRFELLRSEVDTANLRPQVTQADNAVKIGKTGLKSLMGYDLDQPIEIAGAMDAANLDTAYPQARDSAMKNRHELAALDFGLKAQESGTWVSTANMLPKVIVFAAYDYQKPWYFQPDWADYWTVGAGINIPVFDGLSALGKRKESLARERQIRGRRLALAEGIDLQIRRAILDLTEIQGRIVQTRDNVDRAREAAGMVETAYKSGVATNLEVLDAQLALTGAQTLNLQALYDFHIAETRLLAATGRLKNR